ncbi:MULTISPECIES: sodium-dependent transporter [Pontibacter]|uniref:Sodium:calcium symporter n=1 Tax=Pontibacter amylolyticus TaxID=1424080 RepID=A0ABQ1W6R0_9BACT|nr:MULTISPECIES: sodium-dependent transporter [Pontibacter]MCP2042368.1 SNF family Na+-dependent transporter [Pontibacter sp. HSC-36F09]GGG17808.1 sodium:calcium symporter [Pontibacter amylolyticus]
MSANKESWGSRVGLILAMAGNAVGLGNFLRFPVQAVQNGGGAFIIPYLICFLVMGIPLLWIEWSMGRFGGKFGHHSTPFIVDTMHKNRLWKYIGVFGIWTNIAVASYYCYLESWTLSYVFHSLGGTFSGLDQIGVSNFFDEYVNLGESTFGIPYEPIFFFVVCLLLNTWILSQGLAKGVERVAKIGMPLLIVFGMFLAYKGFTINAGENGAINDSSVGLNFLWTPNFDELWSPTVWLAAAGQIFFTLSVGMGTIHCYASYVRSKDDIALNAMSAGWMNEFVEVVLGASILIPISIGYLGIDGVVDLVNSQGGLGLGFRTLPYLFYQWGDVLGAIAGVMWFGLLFFAGITSSLAMGTPWIGFLQDEFNWNRRPAAWSFGLIVLVLGMPTVLFFKYGVFDEYDYWAGTVSLVVFALFESILFAWVFGMNKGWREITSGADIKVPGIYKFIIKFVTPLLLLWVFIGSLITPKGGDWAGAFSNGWELDDSSIINKIKNSNLKRQLAEATDPAVIEQLQETLFFVNASRILLVVVFLSIAGLVYMAYKKRVREGRI